MRTGKIAASTLLSLITAAACQACTLRDVIIDPPGGYWRMAPFPPKKNGSGDTGGGGGGTGGINVSLPSGGMINIKYLGQTIGQPTPTAHGFMATFAPVKAIVTMGSVVINFNTLSSGGWVMDVNEDTTPGHTFTTGLHSFAGMGLGSDGNQYDFSWSALSSDGVFGAMQITGQGPGDPPTTLDILHLIPTQTFHGVTVSLGMHTGNATGGSFADVTCDGFTTCTFVSVPEPTWLSICMASAIALRARRRR